MYLIKTFRCVCCKDTWTLTKDQEASGFWVLAYYGKDETVIHILATPMGLKKTKKWIRIHLAQFWCNLRVLLRYVSTFFRKFSIFEKIRPRGFSGSEITNLTSILSYEASVLRYTTKISTFWKIFRSFFSLN